jgi:AcrR family transcriptional regulator
MRLARGTSSRTLTPGEVRVAESKRRDGRTRDTRGHILLVAGELSAEGGFSETPLHVIADRLELTKAALYYHFATKADLVSAVVQPLMDDTEAFLAHAEAQGRVTGPARLLEGLFDLCFTHRRVLLALTRDPAGAGSGGDWVARFERRVEALLMSAEPTAEQRVRAALVSHGLRACATSLNDVPDAELRAACVRTGLEALGASPADAPAESQDPPAVAQWLIKPRTGAGA